MSRRPGRRRGVVGGQAGFAQAGKGEPVIEVPSTVGGFAFAPKGFRLAVAHYNGVSLWFPNAQAKPEMLEWKGSHLDVAYSPDGQFLVTAMQEPTLHGWRLVDGKHMRMSGYPRAVRSFGWTAGGKFLATSGSEQLVLWPFQGKDGPMGKQPKMLAARGARRRRRLPSEAAGGRGRLRRRHGAAGADRGRRRGAGQKPGDVPVTALALEPTGMLLAFGTEAGEAGVIDLAWRLKYRAKALAVCRGHRAALFAIVLPCVRRDLGKCM